MNFYENLEDAMKNLTTRGAFLTVKNNQGVNTMTISWGYIGFSWNKPYFVAMVRPQRYTYEFLKTAKDYTISIPYSDDMKRIEKDKFPYELKKNYPIDDYHFLYYGEIVDCYN